VALEGIPPKEVVSVVNRDEAIFAFSELADSRQPINNQGGS
jgi:hypothetical protein